jgi:CubicO group peptidase (beta-lactamase class C family)
VLDHAQYARDLQRTGVHGQTIYVDPKAEMVIARFASNPKAANANFEDISLPAYQAIAERLMSPKRSTKPSGPVRSGAP